MEFSFLLEHGLQHEQQHQELLVTDIKHILSINPLKPVYSTDPITATPDDPLPASFVDIQGGLCQIGFNGTAPRDR